MLMRIPVQQLCRGMYVESVECSAAEFNKRRFVIISDEDLLAIQQSSAQWVRINTARAHAPMSNNNERHSTTSMKRAVNDAQLLVKEAFEAAPSLRTGDLKKLTRIADSVGKIACSSPQIFLQVTRLKDKDEATFVHSLAVSGLMMQLGSELGLASEVPRDLALAGLLHDVGKLLIPQDILQKPSKLTFAEIEIVKSHPTLGYDLLKNNPNVSTLVLDVCRHHHECIDGSGYPDGLKGTAVTPASRIASICDVFDALTTSRPYKAAWSTHDALRWMFDQEGKFDRKILLNFAALVDP